MTNKYNWKVIAKDDGYPKNKGSMAALIGIYPSYEGAEFIKNIVRNKYTYSDFATVKTTFPVTVKYPENFSSEKFKNKKKEN